MCVACPPSFGVTREPSFFGHLAVLHGHGGLNIAFRCGADRISSTTMKRVCLSLIVACLAAGCPGSLENPDCFPEQSAPRCSLEDFDVEAYFVDSCGTSTCHGAEHEDSADNAVDLESAGLFDRLSGQIASSPACNELGIPIIDTSLWQNSFLIRKLRATHGSCGDRMPFDGVLPEPQLQCIGRWLVQGGGQVEMQMGGQCAPRAGSDAGPRPDSSVMDAATPAEDTGPGMDAGPAPMDAGNDAGPAFDCTAIEGAGLMLCETLADGCEAVSDASRDCNATCALAGLICIQSTPEEGCSPMAGGGESNCNQEGRMADYCYCGAE
ncbi:MAG: hypothetical protein ACI9KE_001639 [Polyangiales bacterium]